MVGSVQGTSTQDINAINQQKIQDFKDGKTNITKNDLSGMLSGEIAQGQNLSSAVINLVDSYDQIDKNGDGISYKEFATYNSTPAAMLKSLGLTSASVNNSINSSLLSSLNQQSGSSTSDQLSLLDSGLFGDSSSSSSTLDSPTSYLDKLMQNYSKSNSSSTQNSSTSYLDTLMQSYNTSSNTSNIENTYGNTLNLANYLI